MIDVMSGKAVETQKESEETSPLLDTDDTDLRKTENLTTDEHG